MKKIFTFSLLFALLGVFGSNAETVKAYVSTYDYDAEDYVDYQSFTTELTRNDDGSFTLADFLNSGHPVSFKFTSPEVGEYGTLSLCGDVYIMEGYENFPYPIYYDEDGNYHFMVFRVYDSEGGEDNYTEIFDPYIDITPNASKVYHYDMTDQSNTYEYYAMMSVEGYLGDDSYSPTYYVEVYFNDPTSSAITSVESSDETPVIYYNLQGIRVDNPGNGIYIERKGDKAKKVLIRK